MLTAHQNMSLVTGLRAIPIQVMATSPEPATSLRQRRPHQQPAPDPPPPLPCASRGACPDPVQMARLPNEGFQAAATPAPSCLGGVGGEEQPTRRRPHKPLCAPPGLGPHGVPAFLAQFRTAPANVCILGGGTHSGFHGGCLLDGPGS
jgi:hypothetical protein